MMRFSSRILRAFFASGALCIGLCVHAQQAPQQSAAQPPRPAMQMPAPTPNDTLKSVEVKPDRRVRFRILAPKATEVKLHAEGPEATPGITPQETDRYMAGVPLSKGDQGVWEATIGPIEPGVYRYTFTVDGVSTMDPRNPLTSQSLTHASSLYEVPGADFTRVQSGRAARRNRNGLLCLVCHRRRTPDAGLHAAGQREWQREIACTLPASRRRRF